MSELKYEAAGVLGMGLMAALSVTTRVQCTGQEHYMQFRCRRLPVIFVCWHGQLLPLINHHRGEGIVVLVSEHGDGEYLTRVIRRLGYGVVRGSSTRGGTRGLKGLIRAARAGRDLALTPDGPRGPARVFKTGALAVAQVTGLPVIPLAVSSSTGWRLRSWDDFLVPRPLSTLRICYGEPVFVPRETGREALEVLARRVGGTLTALGAERSPADAS